MAIRRHLSGNDCRFPPGAEVAGTIFHAPHGGGALHYQAGVVDFRLYG
jgi:hypothetical protein